MIGPKKSVSSGDRTGKRKTGRLRSLGEKAYRVTRKGNAAFWTIIWRFSWRAATVPVLIVIFSVAYYYTKLPEIDQLYDGRTYGSTVVLDRHSKPFAWRGDQYGGSVTTDSVSPRLLEAILSIEDHRFYRHFGISPRGIFGAMYINIREGRNALEGHGGSTITQQVAKLLCFGEQFDPRSWNSKAEFEQECRQTSLWRKLKEVPFSFALELRYTKDEIFALYLNRVYLGAGANGVEAASRRYFDVPSSHLNTQQGAMLAGMLVAPSRYAPTRSLDLAQRRAATVIDQMVRRGYLSPSEAAIAKITPAVLSTAAEKKTGGYFVDWVIESGPGFLNRNQTEDFIIETTYDGEIQKVVDDAVKHVFETMVRADSKSQVAVVVMSPDGAVRALLGGRNIAASGLYNRAASAKRQTGSLFKPFVFATAIEAGMNYNNVVRDQPISLNVPGSGIWSPRNYNNRSWGELTLTDALAHSVNTIAVRVSESVGRENVRQTARRLGIRSFINPGPALALGTSEATLLEMTGAYAGIRNGGWSVQPHGLASIRLSDSDTVLMEHRGESGTRVLSGSTSRQLVYMMHKVISDGTGQRAKIDWLEVAGKTGTTQEARDAWFIGFSGHYVVGVWMGNDDNTPLTGVTGGGLPAVIWQEIMAGVHADLEPRPLPFPEEYELQ